MKTITTLLLTLATTQAIAQEIAGRVLDEKNKPLIYAVVKAYKGQALTGGTITDFEGNYSIKRLQPGNYNILVCYAGYDSILVKDVVAIAKEITAQNFKIIPTGYHQKPPIIVRPVCEKPPIIDRAICPIGLRPIVDCGTCTPKGERGCIWIPAVCPAVMVPNFNDKTKDSASDK